MDPLPRYELRHADGRRLFVYGSYTGGSLRDDDPGGAWPALHLRHNDLEGRWVAISPARNTRPQSRPLAPDDMPACPLCPGGPELPFPYDAAVFENRFPTLLADPPVPPRLPGRTAPSRGRCEVVLYTPTHEGSLATLTERELAQVVAIWTDRSAELWADPAHRYVLVFENRGEDVGATLSHPHGQIYALDHVPVLTQRRLATLARHRSEHGACLGCSVVTSDDLATQRTLTRNDSFTVAVPFAADWPYEIHVRARRHGARRLPDLDARERHDLAVALRDVVHVYDRVFDAPMAYLMVCQQAPADVDGHVAEDWHLSFEFLPPTRAAGKLKVRASVETAAGLFINDTVPETSAAELAEVVAVTGAGPPALPIPDVEVVHATPLEGTDVG